MPTNEWELRLLFAHQDSRGDLFRWQSMVAPLRLWGAHCDRKIANKWTWEWKIFRHIQTKKYMIRKLVKMRLSVQTKTKFVLARQVLQSANRALARLLKMYWWIALLSLWEQFAMKKRQNGWYMEKKHVQTYSNSKMYIKQVNWQKCNSLYKPKQNCRWRSR